MAKATYTATYNQKDEDGNKVDSIDLTANYDFGDNIQDACKKYGEDVVHAHFVAHAVVSLQARMRAAAKAGQDVEEAINNWKPGQVTRRGKSPVEKALGAFDKMDAEQQQAFIAQLKEAAGK